jgi:hypothetical protein
VPLSTFEAAPVGGLVHFTAIGLGGEFARPAKFGAALPQTRRTAASFASRLFRIIEHECYRLFHTRDKLQVLDQALDGAAAGAMGALEGSGVHHRETSVAVDLRNGISICHFMVFIPTLVD